MTAHFLLKLNRWIFGPVTHIRVSSCEEWELGYFVDVTLRRYGMERSGHNRALMEEIVAAYPGGRRPRLQDLAQFLDEVFLGTRERRSGRSASE